VLTAATAERVIVVRVKMMPIRALFEIFLNGISEHHVLVRLWEELSLMRTANALSLAFETRVSDSQNLFRGPVFAPGTWRVCRVEVSNLEDRSAKRAGEIP
jgi:hypothetical protein